MGWDAGERSRQYRTRANDAESRARKFKSKVEKSDTYKNLHDAALAEFCVYGSLHGRSFLADPEQLVAVLEAMRAAPDASVEVYDRKGFNRAWQTEIDLLIKRVQLELQ